MFRTNWKKDTCLSSFKHFWSLTPETSVNEAMGSTWSSNWLFPRMLSAVYSAKSEMTIIVFLHSVLKRLRLTMISGASSLISSHWWSHCSRNLKNEILRVLSVGMHCILCNSMNIFALMLHEQIKESVPGQASKKRQQFTIFLNGQDLFWSEICTYETLNFSLSIPSSLQSKWPKNHNRER